MEKKEIIEKISKLLISERKKSFKNRKEFLDHLNKNNILDIGINTYLLIENSNKSLLPSEYIALFKALGTEKNQYEPLIMMLEQCYSPLLSQQYQLLQSENIKKEIPVYDIKSIQNNIMELELIEYTLPFHHAHSYKNIFGISIYHKWNFDYTAIIAGKIDIIVKDSAYLFIEKETSSIEENDMIFCIYENQIVMRSYGISHDNNYVFLKQILSPHIKPLIFKKSDFENQNGIVVVGKILMFQHFYINLL